MNRLHFTKSEAADAIRALMRRDFEHPQVRKLGKLSDHRLANVQKVIDHISAERPQGVVHFVSGGDMTACDRHACDEVMTTADYNMVTCYKCRKESDGTHPVTKPRKPRVAMLSADATLVSLGVHSYFVYTGTGTIASVKARYVDAGLATGIMLTDNREAGVANALNKLRNIVPTLLKDVLL